VRVTAERLFGAQTDGSQRVLDQVALLIARLGQLELAERRRQDVVNFVERVVDGERILEDGLNVAPELFDMRAL
jgi:hypothetical protein